MDGKSLVAQMKRLREVEKVKDIRQLTHAMFPGTHCPLMGAMLAARGIQDAYMLVVGTEECTYYTKVTTMGSSIFGGVDSRCLSVVLDQRDVTFGGAEKIEKAFAEMMQEFAPKAVFLVSTCLVEIIGDDIDAIAETLSETYGIHVLPVHTEHFKTENHIPGVADTIAVCARMMRECPKGDFVNILGQRLGVFESTELCRILSTADVPVGMTLPSGGSVEKIEQAAGAKVNIVVDATALKLAKRMEAQFGIPYVCFERLADPDQIQAAYRSLFAHLEQELPVEVEALYQKAVQAVGRAIPKLKGVRYIYGNTPLPVFPYNAFMVRMGMIPMLIQTAELPRAEDENLRYILGNSDPYVTKSANIAPLQYVYDELRPDLYLGHEFAMRLRKKGISLVRGDHLSSMLGYEVTEAVLTELARAADEARELKKERAEA